mmetsp:Transcript_7628/g.22748  ORF Transcript_7628/g.22748 Transcript_7628/m.22748 type:complete len:224 (+) Transcript_7628:440-1111(+)
MPRPDARRLHLAPQKERDKVVPAAGEAKAGDVLRVVQHRHRRVLGVAADDDHLAARRRCRRRPAPPRRSLCGGVGLPRAPPAVALRRGERTERRAVARRRARQAFHRRRALGGAAHRHLEPRRVRHRVHVGGAASQEEHDDLLHPGRPALWISGDEDVVRLWRQLLPQLVHGRQHKVERVDEAGARKRVIAVRLLNVLVAAGRVGQLHASSLLLGREDMRGHL